MKNNLLIIGATSSIISSCLNSFIKKKYQIFASYNSEEKLENVELDVRNSKNIKFFKLDLNQEDQKILEILKKNEVKADMIINAVGGSFGIKDYPENLDNWKKSLDLNILKHILINNFFMREMRRNNFGRILFFSTTAVEEKNSSITYSASKAFLENYVKKSAILFGKNNILTNCIKTSVIAEKNNNWNKALEQNPEFVKEFVKKNISVQRTGKAEDLVDFINLIISENNTFMNGSIVRIDGGVKF